MKLDIERQQPGIVDALIALVGVALKQDRHDLAVPLFDAARRFRPASPRLESFEGWFCLRSGDLVGAQRHLSSAVDKLGSEAGPARCLLAMVMCAQGDPGWESHAQQVIDENRDPHSVYLMKSMRGDEDAVQPPQPQMNSRDAQAVNDLERPEMTVEAESQPAVAAVNLNHGSGNRRTGFLRG